MLKYAYIISKFYKEEEDRYFYQLCVLVDEENEKTAFMWCSDSSDYPIFTQCTAKIELNDKLKAKVVEINVD